MSAPYRYFFCWLCARRRRFRFEYDEDGGNWHGYCGHALWSERQYAAQQKAEAVQ